MLGFSSECDLEKIGADPLTKVNTPGTLVGTLAKQAAEDMHLNPQTPIVVGASMIDAHGGCLGSIGARLPHLHTESAAALDRRMVIVCGTSSCHLTVSNQKIFVPGVWGPYKSAVLPGMWTHEGGQSASGELVTHLINSHPAIEAVRAAAKLAGVHVQLYLSNILVEMSAEKKVPVEQLTRDLHIWPDFHGNR